MLHLVKTYLKEFIINFKIVIIEFNVLSVS